MSLRLLLVLLLICVSSSSCNVEADFSGDVATEILPAESYRAEISAIDRLVFTEGPLGDAGPDALRKVLEGLAGRVERETHTKFGKVESLELKLLASRAGRLPRHRNAGPLRNDWMRIRNNIFDDRAWFARSARDLEYAANEQRVAERAAAVERATKMAAGGETVREVRSSPLAGRWRVVTVSVNGRASADPELLGSTWTFEPPRLTMQTSTGDTESYSYLPEGRYIRATNAANVDGWMLYGQAGDTLFVAFYDGLKGKPESFEPREGQTEPALVKLQLVRAE